MHGAAKCPILFELHDIRHDLRHTGNMVAEGVEIDSKYRLRTRLAESEARSDYETIYRGTTSLIRLFPCRNSAEALTLHGRFARASRFPHPGVLAVYDYGITEFGPGDLRAWVVTERPEECLADILLERCLNEEEARELVAGVQPALEFLNERQLAPVRLTSAEVFACGDRIKLFPDFVDAAAADPTQLAELAREASTGSREPSGAQTAEVVEEPIAAVPETPRPKYRRFAGLAVGGVLAAAALCALLVRGAHNNALVKATPGSFETQTIPVAGPISVSAAKPNSETYPKAKKGWAVAAGSFEHAEDAVKLAAAIHSEHPKWKARVFTLSDRAATDQFVVLFASGMTETQAKRELTRVKRQGAPRGTYAIRFD